jgi:hypothetical protein
MTMFLVLMLVLVGLAWLWIASIRITAEPITMLATRLQFPPGLKLDDAAKAILMLDKPEEIVLPFATASLVIDFPLTTPAKIPISSALLQGFTRGELVKIVCDEYANVYEAEEGTAATKTIPLDERGDFRNRNRTDGVYGIWGHDLDELELAALRWTRQSDGKILIELTVTTAAPRPPVPADSPPPAVA